MPLLDDVTQREPTNVVMARILIVNDEADLVDLCEMVLEEAGHECTALTDGRRALEMARRSRPDLIVLDWLMPQSKGDELLRQLRTDPETARIRVLLVSAMHDGEIKARTYAADGFLKKPFDADALLHAVRQLLPPEHPGTGSADSSG
jgi:two-component system, OmpR family, phosphate regulon response regulator PhoB